jgi:hypothetical protein
MAKDDKKKKVKSRVFTKYTTSSDEGSSSEDEDDLLSLFANLNMQQKEKLNELISAIHEKDELLDSQEDFLIKENKKHVKVKNAYAQEIEKCEKLTSELSICHDTISNLRNENGKLLAKVEKLNVCDDSLVNLKNDNASLFAKIDKLNESLASLKNENDKLISKSKDAEHELENEKFKFARSMLYNGDALALKMALVSNRETMSSLMPLRNCLILLRVRLPWLRITRAIFYILLVIPSIRLGEFMLGNLIMFHIMVLCIKMRLLALGNQPMLNFLKRKLLLHQMNLMSHLRLLMLLMF